MKTLPQEIRVQIFSSLDLPQRANCRNVCSVFCDDIDAWLPFRIGVDVPLPVRIPPLRSDELRVILENPVIGPKWDENVWNLPRNYTDAITGKEIHFPTLKEVRQAPELCWNKFKDEAPYFSSLPGILSLVSRELSTNGVRDQSTLDFGYVAARYARGWHEIGTGIAGPSTGSNFNHAPSRIIVHLDAWLKYAVEALQPTSNTKSFPLKKLLGLPAPTQKPDFLGGKKVLEREAWHLAKALVQGQIFYGMTLSLGRTESLAYEVAATAALPVRAVCDAAAAAGLHRDAVDWFAREVRAELGEAFGDLPLSPDNNYWSSLPWPVKMHLGHKEGDKKLFLDAFDEIVF